MGGTLGNVGGATLFPNSEGCAALEKRPVLCASVSSPHKGMAVTVISLAGLGFPSTIVPVSWDRTVSSSRGLPQSRARAHIIFSMAQQTRVGLPHQGHTALGKRAEVGFRSPVPLCSPGIF